MDRVPEPELMDDEAQVDAYARADFSEPHSHFIALFKQHMTSGRLNGVALDLGCGPGDISFRFAVAFPEVTVHALDGAENMLRYAQNRLLDNPLLAQRLYFFQGMLQNATLPGIEYEILISNSLLHHLHDPGLLWKTIKRFGAAGSTVFVMDLLRPATLEQAKCLVGQYAAAEAEILQRDFYNSLRAAFSLEEVKTQLSRAGLLQLQPEQVSDRHFIVYGKL